MLLDWKDQISPCIHHLRVPSMDWWVLSAEVLVVYSLYRKSETKNQQHFAKHDFILCSKLTVLFRWQVVESKLNVYRNPLMKNRSNSRISSNAFEITLSFYPKKPGFNGVTRGIWWPIPMSNCRLLKLLFQGKFATGNATDLGNELLVERSREGTLDIWDWRRDTEIFHGCVTRRSQLGIWTEICGVFIFTSLWDSAVIKWFHHAPRFSFFSKTLCCISWFKVTCWEDGCFQSISWRRFTESTARHWRQCW